MDTATWQDGTLTISGRGRTMVYSGVPQQVYNDLTRAVSPGKYFNFLIKPRFKGG